MANYKEKIASIDEEMQQLANRKKEYIQRERAAERKARNHRICKRGGHLESVLPALINLTDEQFNMFIKRTLLTEYATRELDKIKPQTAPTESPETEGATEQTADVPAEKPGESAKTSATTANANAEKSRNGAA